LSTECNSERILKIGEDIDNHKVGRFLRHSVYA